MTHYFIHGTPCGSRHCNIFYKINKSFTKPSSPYFLRIGVAKPNNNFDIKQKHKKYSLKIPLSTSLKPNAIVHDSESYSKFIRFYRHPGLPDLALSSLLKKCFNVELNDTLTNREYEILCWLLNETFEPDKMSSTSIFSNNGNKTSTVLEVGPRMNFSTAWSSNAISICNSCGLNKVSRIERSRRFYIASEFRLDEEKINKFAMLVHDRMTEQVYKESITSFRTDVMPAKVVTIPVIKEGKAALEKINNEMGLAFDEWDLNYYTNLFLNDMKRDPTNVELFDIAQSNSEHCRHWFFKGDIIIGDEKMPYSLMDIVRAPLKANPNNSVIAFNDNSSAIRGGIIHPILPSKPGEPCSLFPIAKDWDVLLTAETHNFPCAVAPYPGAETGTGGRIRDTHATGKGSFMGAATAGYCTGNLNLKNYELNWENKEFKYPDNLASPAQILIDASNGASDYGNKFGEPVICGFTRTFGSRLCDGSRREWIKPIMFSGGIGQIDHEHLKKDEGKISMLVVKIGGPAYRIGMGGGAASSLPGGSNKAELDFNAVQRGDAEMAQKLWRVVRACVEMGSSNPIVQIHDQGAGGNCNVVKEIIYPLGAEININAITKGDESLSVLEIWGAEYQENDCLLIYPKDRKVLEEICKRERCDMQVIGEITGSGRVVIKDGNKNECSLFPVDLDLEKVLGKMPNKTFISDILDIKRKKIKIPENETPMTLLNKILRLPSVCSKRFLTTKVDRNVTGLVAQQQCVGPLQIPISDVGVLARTHQDFVGIATAIGEQPLKGLIDPAAMSRMAIGEALTNLVWAKITNLSDVRASVNWMYAAKMKSEGAAMYEAAIALKDAMIELGIACDGGKDSLSMSAVANEEIVMAPGNMVVSAYCTCSDITLTVTPDLKLGNKGIILHVDLSDGQRRLGGSAISQVINQIGNECPDIILGKLKSGFEVTQSLIGIGVISAGHDISDGGIATTLLEMAFAGNCGLCVDLPQSLEVDVISVLFSEELGLIIEVSEDVVDHVQHAYQESEIKCNIIGKVTEYKNITIKVKNETLISGNTEDLRDIWEETSFELEKLQCAENCVLQEKKALSTKDVPKWNLSFRPQYTSLNIIESANKIPVAVIREEGSNGDREMAAAIYAAGMDPWDITMSDLLNSKISLSSFRGIIFVGGFSYADVLDSAKGWAASICFNSEVLSQFEEFRSRSDTFSLGVCNGCQLMALLGWVSGDGKDISNVRFLKNISERFESRWTNVRIEKGNPSIMLSGMEGSIIGIWCAHGEGRVYFPDNNLKYEIEQKNLIPIRYCDANGSPTESYPMNPNGSPNGIAALCSEDGRHLAMMPHPERSFLTWQMPWYPKNLSFDKKGPSPWLKMFQNAREWCMINKAKK